MSLALASWKERLTLFGLTASITAVAALIELQGRSRLPLISGEVGYATHSVSDIVQGGIVFAALLEWGAIVWRDRRHCGPGYRALGRPILRTGMDAGIAIALLAVLELCLRPLAVSIDLPLSLAIALASTCCGVYQLFVTRTKNAAPRSGEPDASKPSS